MKLYYIRALLGQTYHWLGYDNHTEPFLMPQMELAWHFKDRGQAEDALKQAMKVPRLNTYPMEIYTAPEEPSNGD